jgi:hypothetical protein
MRHFTVILQDGFYRNYRVELVRGAKGQFPSVKKIEREVIAGPMQAHVWSLYRECCDGKLPATLKDAIRDASNTIAGA